MFTRKQVQFLKRLRRGAAIKDDELDMAYEMAAIGVLRLGYHDGDDDEFCETARLTPLGVRLLRADRIQNSAWRRFLDDLPVWG